MGVGWRELGTGTVLRQSGEELDCGRPEIELDCRPEIELLDRELLEMADLWIAPDVTYEGWCRSLESRAAAEMMLGC